jgi:hypothetical protein
MSDGSGVLVLYFEKSISENFGDDGDVFVFHGVEERFFHFFVDGGLEEAGINFSKNFNVSQGLEVRGIVDVRILNITISGRLNDHTNEKPLVFLQPFPKLVDGEGVIKVCFYEPLQSLREISQ